MPDIINSDKTEPDSKLCDKIIASIKKARFVVADFTELKRNVFYEAGFARGMGIPVFQTIRKKEMDSLQERGFDIRQYGLIDWESEAELTERLESKIKATINEGNYRPGTR